MKAYGIPVQSVVWKQPCTTASPLSSATSVATAAVTPANGAFLGAFVKAEPSSSTSGTLVRTISTSSNNTCNSEADSTVTVTASTPITVKQELPDLETASFTSKQLEEFMDDDCHGPVTSGDPMLSSPHLSPHDVLPSPASSGKYVTD